MSVTVTEENKQEDVPQSDEVEKHKEGESNEEEEKEPEDKV